MSVVNNLLSWTQVQAQLGESPSLLLGNGFSIACDPAFKYNNLVDEAKKTSFGLSPNAVKLFGDLDTTNFEEVLRDMDMAAEIATRYGCSSPCRAISALTADVKNTKNALVAAITQVHGNVPDRFSLSDCQKDTCGEFLSRYKYIYTLNYDFLLYWVWLHAYDKGKVQGGDGFNKNQVFDGLSSAGGFRLLHGALHLYTANGYTLKHKSSTGSATLLDKVKDGFAKAKYPLFVAEGTSKKKLAGIKSNDYLHSCYSEFSRVPSELVVFGCNFGSSDQHIVEAITRNEKLTNLYVANHGPNLSNPLLETLNMIVRKRGTNKPISISWFDSTVVKPWG